MGKLIGFVITAGHLDIEWYQPMRSYRFWTMEIMEDLKRIAAERPDFKNYVLDGQVFPLEEYLEVVPEDEAAMKELIRRGILTVGPFYTQFDEWLPSAESMIRNCLYGLRKARGYGGAMMAGYLPDNFGHPLQLPQILNGFGIGSLLFMRGMPEIEGGHPDEFIYRGIDGSEVMASHFREGYGGAFDLFHKRIDPIQPRDVPYYDGYLSYEWHRELARHEEPALIARNMIQNVRAIASRYPSGVVPLISGFDHLPPQPNIGDCIRLANESQADIEFIWGTPEEYAALVRGRMGSPAVYAMELTGSRYQYVLLGALSTRSYLKRKNFAAEALIERYAEPLAAMASLFGMKPPQRLLDEAWRNLMINSAHDSIHGSSVDEVHVEMEARYDAVNQIAAGMIHGSLKHLAGRLSPWWGSGHKPLIAYAPAGAAHPQPCELWIALGDGPVAVTDQTGRQLPTQVLPREPVELNSIGFPRNELFPLREFRKVLFVDSFVQGGVRSYACEPAPAAQPSALTCGETFLENEFLRMEVRGALIGILDKRTGRWSHNLNLLEEEADAGDAWDYAPPWTKGELIRSTQFPFAGALVESGPVRAAIEMRGVLEVPDHLEGDNRSAQRARIETAWRIELYAGVPRVDVTLTLNNTARDHRIRLRVPMGVKSKTIKSQGHLALLERPIERQREIEPWVQPPTQLLPFREWVAADDGRAGLAIAFRGVYDYEAVTDPLNNEPELRFTLVRGVGMMGRINTVQRKGGASWAHPTPGAQCLGEQVIRWCYIPYEAQAEEKAPFLPTAQSFLYPAVAHAIRPEAPAAGDLTGIAAPVCWEERNICFSALKPSLDGTGYILRAYENQGRETVARFRLNGFARASLANMNEEALRGLPVEGGCVDVEFGPYKCVTLLLTV